MRKNLKKILVVRFSSIGDLVLCSPVIRALKKQLGVELHLLTKKKFAGLYAENPYVDHIWTIDKKIDERLADLKHAQYDYLIDLHKNIRSLRVKSALKVPSLSFDKINLEKWLRVYTRMNLLPKLHLVDRYFNGLEKLGVKNDGAGLDFFYSAKAKTILYNTPYHSLDLRVEKYLVISLGANYFTKRVPEHLVKAVITHFQQPIVLIGGADVEDLGAALAEERENVINLCGKINIDSSAAVMDHATVVISGDTGMMHIAAALKKPIVMVWGSTHRQLGMYPYYGAHKIEAVDLKVASISCSPCSKIGRDKCPLGHYKCLNLQQPKAMIRAVEKQLLRYT